jgi:RNA polymerase sigma factor (sigma-70 family)
MDSDLDSLVEHARTGSREALGQLVEKIKDRVYGLAMRMLGHPADAEDATQEILIKTVTHLGDFRGESSFASWVYRIACNHLLTTRKRRAERRELTFGLCERHIDNGLAEAPPQRHPEAEQGLIVEELMLACMQAILLCLDRGLRLAYILGEVLDFSSEQGADILDISPVAFRKRVSRGRIQVRNFMQKNCGLVNPSNRCQCARLIPHTVRMKWLRPDKLQFSNHPRTNRCVGVAKEDLERMAQGDRVKALFRSHPDYIAPLLVSEVFGAIMNSVSSAIQGDPETMGG